MRQSHRTGARADPRDRRNRRSRGDRSVNTTDTGGSAGPSIWDSANLDVSNLVPLDFKKIASAVDDQVSALRDLVGQQMTPRGTQRSANSMQTAESLEVEDVAIEVEYVEDTSSEHEAASDHGVYASPEKAAQEPIEPKADSDMLPGEPSFERQPPNRKAYV